MSVKIFKSAKLEILIKMIDLAKIHKAIQKSQKHLFKFQNEDGSFSGNVDFHIWANSAYLLLIDYLGIPHPKKNAIIRWILEHQNEDGSWGDITESSQGNYRNTLIALEAIKEYIPSKQMEKAEKWIKTYHGNKWLDPYTQMFLSIKKKDIKIFSPPLFINLVPLKFCKLFGKLHIHFPSLFSWSIILYPSAWTRNALPSLQIVANLKNKSGLGFIKKHLFKMLEKKLLKAQLENGSWFTALPTMGAIYALHELGYKNDDARIVKGLKFLEALTNANGHLNRFCLTVWNTSLAIMALKESDTNDISNIKNAIKFILMTQTIKGGWSFDTYNRSLPDNDDTALAILALRKISGDIQINQIERSICRGIKYLLSMQNDDGGWGAFDKNQSYKKPGRLPPYHEEYGHELKDPSTADVTGHVLQALGKNEINISNKRIKKAIRWLQKDQLPFGGWWGRWGICYLYGTTQVLQGLSAIGEDMNKNYVKTAIDWLINVQNRDGGWGEHYSSYYSEKPIIGKSTVEQTSWVIIALMECGINEPKIIEKGITFLLEKQNTDGSFPTAYTVAAIDPGKYEIYSSIFPLMALSKYKKRCET